MCNKNIQICDTKTRKRNGMIMSAEVKDTYRLRCFCEKKFMLSLLMVLLEVF